MLVKVQQVTSERYFINNVAWSNTGEFIRKMFKSRARFHMMLRTLTDLNFDVELSFNSKSPKNDSNEVLQVG